MWCCRRQSSDPKSYDEVLADITAAAQEKGVFVYSLGLGDGVDANYLESIAKAAGGTYAYVTSSETLASFYQDLETRKDCSYVSPIRRWTLFRSAGRCEFRTARRSTATTSADII